MIHSPKISNPSAEHIVKWGGYNDFPPGWTEISEAEFARSGFFIYGPQFSEFRQMIHDLMKAPAVSTWLHFIDSEHGYAIVNNYWKESIKFYRFGCKHSFKETKRHSMHVYTVTCQNCGIQNTHDSSD